MPASLVQIGFREDSVSKGVVLSVSASVLFAVMYYFTSLLTPLSGLEIFGWRMLLTVPCMTVFMIVSGEWRRVWKLLQVLAAKPRLIAGVVLSSALLGVQLWLFMWAPLNGRSLDVSVGYFLLPLTMVLTGRLVWGEQLSYPAKDRSVLCRPWGTQRVVPSRWVFVGNAGGDHWLSALLHRAQIP